MHRSWDEWWLEWDIDAGLGSSIMEWDNNEVFLRVTNHTGQAEKNLLGPAGIRTCDLRFTNPMLYQLSYRSSWELVVTCSWS